METASQAARAYLSCDRPSLAAFSDDSRLGGKCFLPEDTVHVEAIQPCGVAGNDRLAFVSLASTFVAEKHEPPPALSLPYGRWLMENALGQQTILAVLRKQGGTWRLLAISDDPFDTNPSVYPAYSNSQCLASLLTNETVDAIIPAPAALTTADGAKVRRLSQTEFESFEWTPSTAPNTVAEVVGENSEPRQRTRLFFFLAHENRLSSGFLWGRAGRWRVWSISRTGSVTLTESRSYTNW